MPLSDSSVRSLESQFNLEDYVPNKTILEGRQKNTFPLYILMDFFVAAFSFRHFRHFIVDVFHVQRMVDLTRMDRSSVFDVMEYR